MLKITHPVCDKVAFYVPNMPVGRGILPIDAINEYEFPIAMGNIVECVSCGKKVDLKEINDYYEVEAE